MKCSNCGKNNANITYKQNINGEIINLNLCESCAHKLGIFNSFDDIFSPMILDLDYILPLPLKPREILISKIKVSIICCALNRLFYKQQAYRPCKYIKTSQ